MPNTDALRLPPELSREFLLHHRVCPIAVADDGRLHVAVAPDAVLDVLDELLLAYGAEADRVQTETVALNELEQLVERLTTRSERAIELTRGEHAVGGDEEYTTDARDLANQPPVVRYVNLLVRDAYDAGASDVHLEATRAGLIVRYRVDGVLIPALEPPAAIHAAVVNRIKLLAELDIAERRRPQDGRIWVRLEHQELDLRVSTVPTMFGESVVLRLLDRGGGPVALGGLGMSPEMTRDVARMASRPHGMLLVTGPTGSGKTTTLYACLQHRDAAAEKIITVEDPIEYHLATVTQVPVHRQAGLTFGAALRSILRQDPDVVMIGEMRDQETAAIAVQAAMTGHLVLSTLHTNDAVGAIPRLLDLEVPEYLVGAVLEGVLAQRLVRRICDACRADYRPPPDLIAEIVDGPVGRPKLQHGLGCSRCRQTGFRGRIGLFELLVIDDPMREAISRGASQNGLRDAARASGMRTLRSDGWRKVQAGLTTVEEVLRVVQA